MSAALADFWCRYLHLWRVETGGLPTTDFDGQWPSPCEVGEADSAGRVHWQPVEREPEDPLAGMENAIDGPLHQDIKAYYGGYFAECVTARHADGGLTLIQAWSREDFDRLVANQLGHTMAKFKAKLPLTVFIALTDEDDWMISVDNATGEVVLESPAAAPQRVVAPNLETFLRSLQPVVSHRVLE